MCSNFQLALEAIIAEQFRGLLLAEKKLLPHNDNMLEECNKMKGGEEYQEI
jgi:hypothetical protein